MGPTLSRSSTGRWSPSPRRRCRPAGSSRPRARTPSRKVEQFVAHAAVARCRPASRACCAGSTRGVARRAAARSRTRAPAKRLALLERWRHGDPLRRLMLRALVSPLKMAHFDDPTLYQQLGCVYEAAKVTGEAKPAYMRDRVHAAARRRPRGRVRRRRDRHRRGRRGRRARARRGGARRRVRRGGPLLRSHATSPAARSRCSRSCTGAAARRSRSATSAIPIPLGQTRRRHDDGQLRHLLPHAGSRARASGATSSGSTSSAPDRMARLLRARRGGARRRGRARRAARRQRPRDRARLRRARLHAARPAQAQRARVRRPGRVLLRLPDRRQALDQRQLHPDRAARRRRAVHRREGHAHHRRGRARARRGRAAPRTATCSRCARARSWSRAARS